MMQVKLVSKLRSVDYDHSDFTEHATVLDLIGDWVEIHEIITLEPYGGLVERLGFWNGGEFVTLEQAMGSPSLERIEILRYPGPAQPGDKQKCPSCGEQVTWDEQHDPPAWRHAHDSRWCSMDSRAPMAMPPGATDRWRLGA